MTREVTADIIDEEFYRPAGKTPDLLLWKRSQQSARRFMHSLQCSFYGGINPSSGAMINPVLE